MGRVGGRDMFSGSQVPQKLVFEVGRGEHTPDTDDSSCRLAKQEMDVVPKYSKAFKFRPRVQNVPRIQSNTSDRVVRKRRKA
jgi:hypothetical protein